MTQTSPSPVLTESRLPTSSMAIVSLVAGILGFAGPVLFSIVALVTGYAARQDIRARPAAVGGDGLATAGIILGWIQIGLIFLIVCASLALLALGAGVWISLASQ